MIAVLRISGQVGLHRDVNSTLDRLRLRKKFTCVVFENPTEVDTGMMNRVKDFVAYGEISAETYKALVEKRKTTHKNFFRLHPPRGGIDSKKHFGVKKGVLGKNKKMDELIGRML